MMSPSDSLPNDRHLRGGEGGQDWLERVSQASQGLKGIRLITSDACIGLAESTAEFFPDAAWQRCVVHRNIFSHVSSTKVREIAAMLKAIHASEDIAAAREKATRVIEKLRGLRLARAAELVEAAVEETLAYYAFPEEHWRRIRTTIRSSASCVRSGGAPASWERSLTVNPRSTSPPPGYATVPARHGRPRDISISSCSRISR